MEFIVAALGGEKLSAKQMVAVFKLALSKIVDPTPDAR